MEKKIKSDLIYDGKIIKVYKDEIETANGVQAIREVVRHHGGVGILAMQNNKIILVKQFRYPNNMYTLEIPAGKIETNEDVEECAMRELEEETGYSAKVIHPISKFLPTPGYSDEWLYIYEAKDIFRVENPLPSDEDEDLAIVEMEITEAYRKVIDGTIVDGKTVIAIMHAYINHHFYYIKHHNDDTNTNS
ncbi:MAG: NUDIX hydrolase [Coprobacillaceae bacterium]